MCPHGWRCGRHPGAEGCWDAIIVLPSIPFCPYNGRQVSLKYLPAVARYMTQRFYQRKLAKSRNNTILARKAVAHKLVRACYYLMRDLVPFEEMKAFG